MSLARKKKAMSTSTKVILANTPYLVIVESPSKCAKIEKYLGFEYKCIASKGHIRELVKVGTAKQNYKPTYNIISEKAAHVLFMKSIVSQFLPGNVFLGTDDDREGEAIAWHICEVCNLDPNSTKRILFNEITKPALQKAIKVPITVRMNIVHAQQARQILDRMIGFKISPLLSKWIARDDGKFLSAGRCQTPTLRLIYDKYKSSEEKEVEVNYKIKGTFFQEPSLLVGTLDKTFSAESELETFLQESSVHSHIFHIRDGRQKSTKPPKPFNTSNLLQYASSYLSISPKRVMECCQTLYQDGHITYMRTDSREYAHEFLQGQMKEFLIGSYGETYLGDLDSVTNKNDQNPHEAIRITDIEQKTVEYKDTKTMDVYRVIWKRTIESCMTPYEFQEYKCTVDAPQDSHYHSTVEEPIFLGWKRATTTLDALKTQQLESIRKIQYWRNFVNKSVLFRKLESTLQVKNRETHYQESSLVQALENLGIGRPSTYSMLVDVIQDRKYALKQDIEGTTYHFNEHTLQYPDHLEVKAVNKTFGASKNQLCIQPIGIQCILALYEHFPTLFDYEYTSQMETQLDKIVQDDTIEWQSVCLACEKTIQECLKPIQHKMRKTYSIDETHELVFGKTGAVIRIKGTKEYKSVKKDYQMDWERLEKGEVPLQELLEVPNDCLGKYEDEDLLVKKGPYGAYVQWGSKKENIDKMIRGLKIPLGEIQYDQVVSYIEQNRKKKSPLLLREISDCISIRKGKTPKAGNYIFYKTETMSKPIFINLRKCPHDVLKDEALLIHDWVTHEYGE